MELGEPVPLQAVYIPVAPSRPEPAVGLEHLLAIADHVYVVPTVSTPKWLTKYPGVKEIRVSPLFATRYRGEGRNMNPSTGHRPGWDIPLKREFALQHARGHGHKFVLLLDDDIFVSSSQILRAQGLMGTGLTHVGFHVPDYPDISTIDHLERRFGLNGRHVRSMTGSCLLVDCEAIESPLFPNIYNDDLFHFMLQGDFSRIASAGDVRQRPHEPWVDSSRVRHEQLGDIIFEAIKWHYLNSHEGDSIDWSSALTRYAHRLAMVGRFTPRTPYQTAQTAAQATVQKMTPEALEAAYLSLNLPRKAGL